MAKMYGFSGKITGKKGDAVFRVRSGEQIVSQYNPIVSNPKTAKQTDNRSKLKLVSQLSAVMANVIAIRPVGAVSARNLFTKVNYPSVNVVDGEAEIKLNAIQLTNSTRGFGAFSVDRSTANQPMSVQGTGLNGATRMVAVLVVKDAKGNLQAAASAVADVESDGVAEAELPYTDAAVAVLCYAETDLNGRAQDAFGNLVSPTAADVAKIVSSRSLMPGDIQLSKTAGVYMEVGTTTADSEDFNSAVVSLTVTGSGSATGDGRYTIGAECSLVASPYAGATFQGFYVNGQQVSTSLTYSFTVTGDVSVEARFSALPPVTITVNPEDAQKGSVEGGGSYAVGSQCTVIATPNAGFAFSGWYEGNNLVSTASQYVFTVTAARTLEARFVEALASKTVTTRPITPQGNPVSDAELTGAGEYQPGVNVTVTAPASAPGYGDFSGWYSGGIGVANRVSTSASYTFEMPNSDYELFAMYGQPVE